MSEFMQEETMQPTYFIPTIDYCNDNLSNVLKIRNYKKKIGEGDDNVNEFNIVSYKKEELSGSDDKLGPVYNLGPSEYTRLGHIRSLIFSQSGELICFTPPKSVSYDTFTSKYDYNNDNIIIEEFIEGTMISVFYNKDTNTWDISTKSFLGANNHFFKSDGVPMTFHQMFDEICSQYGFNYNNESILDKTLCYTFIIQHPDNRIVTKFTNYGLTLVGLFKIQKKDDIGWNVYEYNKQFIANHLFDINTKLLYPIKFAGQFMKIGAVGHNLSWAVQMPGQLEYTNFGYSSLCDHFTNHVPATVMGCVIKNMITGERTKIRNPKFEYIRELRGNQPKLEFHYLELRKNGRLPEFLQIYPEYSSKMYGYQQKIHSFTNQLYNKYISCYIKKEGPLHQYPKEYRTHMFNIHRDVYISKLQPNKQSIQKHNVIQYVNDLPERLLMYCLNLKHRPENNNQHEQQVQG